MHPPPFGKLTSPTPSNRTCLEEGAGVAVVAAVVAAEIIVVRPYQQLLLLLFNFCYLLSLCSSLLLLSPITSLPANVAGFHCSVKLETVQRRTHTLRTVLAPKQKQKSKFQVVSYRKQLNQSFKACFFLLLLLLFLLFLFRFAFNV